MRDAVVFLLAVEVSCEGFTATDVQVNESDLSDTVQVGVAFSIDIACNK